MRVQGRSVVIPGTKQLADQGLFSGKRVYDLSVLYGTDAESDGSSAVMKLKDSSYQLVLNLSEDGEKMISARWQNNKTPDCLTFRYR